MIIFSYRFAWCLQDNGSSGAASGSTAARFFSAPYDAGSEFREVFLSDGQYSSYASVLQGADVTSVHRCTGNGATKKKARFDTASNLVDMLCRTTLRSREDLEQ